MMLRVGLTGSLAAGKSTVADMFRSLGIPVISADAIVHDLYAPGGRAVGPVGREFPQALDDHGGIDRHILSRIIHADDKALKRLEEIVHPLVAEERERFFRKCAKEGHPYAIAEIPLLFETGAEKDFDVIIAVLAPETERLARAMQRPGMTEEKFRTLSRRQLPQDEKRLRADYVLDTSGDLERTRKQVIALHETLLKRASANQGENE
ncbi:dephospho-CoA kinase [Thermopetrobacter sp. TC1]|uniref:dephospho-CoA kinase n=1 Tax=Thermopetrobacter sp. TC1 TaxID=1495045 RepID=UPI000AE0C28C|nr:dephospho-CoA kinase [Thermopetrobacter sp. TC1]